MDDALDINPVTVDQALLHNIADGTPSISDINPVTNDQALLKYIAENGGGGGGGTTNYNNLSNKPQINSVTLTGNKTAANLGLVASANGAMTGTTTAENITVSGDLVADSVDVTTSITVPTPSDNTDATTKLYVDTADNSLSTRITNLQNIGRFLAIWNATTGVATSDPPESPYTYKTGDYFRIGVTGNRIPTGTTYTIGGTNYTTTTDTLTIGDVYYYDGTVWRRQAAGSGGTVQDVQVNSTSVLSGGIANIPVATTSSYGVGEAETWTFTLSDGTTTTKSVLVA